jgi:hypothetical protein
MKQTTWLVATAVVAVVAVGLLLAPTAVAAKSIYRGVATNAWSGGCADINALSNTSWYYNWGLQPTANVASCNLGSRYLEYVPMVWGAGSVPNLVSKVRRRAPPRGLVFYVRTRSGLMTCNRSWIVVGLQLPSNTKYLLGFNEPNFASQANLSPKVLLSPHTHTAECFTSDWALSMGERRGERCADVAPRKQDAATEWKKVIAQLAAAGLTSKIKLGTPSASPGGNIGPKEWYVALRSTHSLLPFDAHRTRTRTTRQRTGSRSSLATARRASLTSWPSTSTTATRPGSTLARWATG